MIARRYQYLPATVLLIVSSAAFSANETTGSPWQEEFDLAGCNIVNTGRSPYFVMEPGFQLILESEDTKVQITVLDETETVDGVVTRVVEEKEWENGELYEIARNYFALCEETKDVFYFGEHVNFYEKGEVINHDGSWLAGENGNRAGLVMAGNPTPQMKYYQEIAPGVAMDRAEIVSTSETCETPAGTFSGCLKIKEGTALNDLVADYKYYAPEIGMIQDADLKLTKYGFVSH